MIEAHESEAAEPIYLDGFATMPLAPEALAAMLAAWARPANAGSPHHFGELAAGAIATARASVAHLIGAAPSEILFTSGATEANNLALTGICQRMASADNERRRIVVSSVEHKAVLEPAQALAARGFDIVTAPVDRHGLVDLMALSALVDDTTLLVSVMAANNETGALQPIREVAAIAHERGGLMHCDAAQAVGKIPVDVVELDVDYLSLSSHKLYGPVGVGALYVAAGAPAPAPLVLGGGQEGGLRSGTEPVPLIAGFGAAAQLAAARLHQDAAHGNRLAASMLAHLQERQVGFSLTINGTPALPGSLSLRLHDVEADDVVLSLQKKVCLSTGSACSSGQTLPSHVLESMGLSKDEAKSVLRLFFTRYTSDDDIHRAATLIAETCLHIRHRSGRSRQ
jgi:cysteine desulfurase